MDAFGGVVRARCGATGRSIGYGLVLFVSAMDNDLCIDVAAPEFNPWASSPLPTVDECRAAACGLRYRNPVSL